MENFLLTSIVNELRLRFHKTRLTDRIHFSLTADETFALIEFLEKELNK